MGGTEGRGINRPQTQLDQNIPIHSQRWTMGGMRSVLPQAPLLRARHGPDTAHRPTLTNQQTHTDMQIPKSCVERHRTTTSKAVASACPMHNPQTKEDQPPTQGQQHSWSRIRDPPLVACPPCQAGDRGAWIHPVPPNPNMYMTLYWGGSQVAETVYLLRPAS